MTSSGTPLSAAAVSHALEEAPCDAARERRVSARDAAQERGDLLGRLGLQQVARGARPDRGKQVLLRVGRGEHDDLGRRGALADLRQRRETVHAGHREVEEDDVRLQLRGRASMASAPSSASPTTSNPCCASRAESASRVSGWSSTMRTRSVTPSYRQQRTADK